MMHDAYDTFIIIVSAMPQAGDRSGNGSRGGACANAFLVPYLHAEGARNPNLPRAVMYGFPSHDLVHARPDP
jgi:hypothetical protein